MRSVYLALGAIILASSRVSADSAKYPACSPPTAKDYALLGPVKTVRAESAKPGGTRTLDQQYSFDGTGRLLEERHPIAAYDSTGTTYQVFRTRYEPRGRNYETDTFGVDSAHGAQESDLQRHFVKFDLRNRCIEEKTLEGSGELLDKNNYAYDDRGDLVSITARNEDNLISSVEHRTYGSHHELLAENTVADRGQGLTYRWSREHGYDERGNEIEMLSRQQGVLEARWIYQYDEHNRLIAARTIVADPQKDHHLYGRCSDCALSSGETTYRYNAAGQQMEKKVLQSDGTLVSSETYLYDSHGNGLRAPGHSYRYDARGNWIEEIAAGQIVRYRVIEYY